MTILGCNKQEYKKAVKRAISLIAAASVVVIVLNVLLTVFRTDATHIAFLCLNIFFDVAVVWSLIATLCLYICPKQKILRLYERGENQGNSDTGVIDSISEKTMCVLGFQCYTITLENDSGKREFSLIENKIKLGAGDTVKIVSVDGMIVSAEVVE